MQANEVATAYTTNGRVFRVTDGNNNLTTYECDGYDRLARTRWAYDAGSGSDTGLSTMIAEYNASNALLCRFVHGPGVDEPLVWYEGTGTTDRRWPHADERGSIVAISDGAGAVTGTNTYDEYGRPTSPTTGRFQYTGQVWIASLGMYYYRARFCHPGLGRFMQADPIGYGAGMNMYAYVGGDPVNLLDPSGLTPRASDEFCTGTRICTKNGAWGGICNSCSGFSSGSPTGNLSTLGSGEGGMSGGSGGFNTFRVTVKDMATGLSQISFRGEGFGWLAGLSWSSEGGREHSILGDNGGGDPGIGHNRPPSAIGAFFKGVLRLGGVPTLIFSLGGDTCRTCDAPTLSVNAILANPELLRGLSPGDLKRLLGNNPNWRETTLFDGSREGQGWVYREWGGRDWTGRQIRWHPGGGQHGPNPYWRVNAGQGQGARIPAGPW